ncbi:hypothetical protein ACFQMA_04775 [Halosimplex aquaticum]|uniref:DUF7344 domain-containing protein n=1 Tax=Halosimplex aquaticum TaxID=3026162 RepID=A0ABD5Y0F0_9EURY|nr:hypothetical protein [Halosimplex aquaticum]
MDDTLTLGDLPDGDGTLSRDGIFDLLAEQRRRYVVAYLDEAEASVAVTDLARRIVQWESEQSSSDPDPEAVSRSLHHCHLPKLEDADVVAYDADTTEVRPGPNFDRLWKPVYGEGDTGAE